MELEDQIYERLIDHKQDVFITGKSGAGKSFLTRKVIEKLQDNRKSFIVTGTTGIAARNLHNSAVTINSALRLGIIQTVEEYGYKRTKYDADQASLIASLDVIMLEEVSMSSADFYSVIKHHLDRYGFKGAILNIGDLYQLAPVTDSYNPNHYYCFQSADWLCYSYILNEIKRVDDPEFIEYSNLLRDGNYDVLLNETNFINYINEHCTYKYPECEYTKLYSTNNEVDRENQRQYDMVQEEEKVFKGKFKKSDYAINNKIAVYEDAFWKDLLVEQEIKLKVGCRVMTVVNNKEQGFINGDVGTIDHFVYDAEAGMSLPVVYFEKLDKLKKVGLHKFEKEVKHKHEYEVGATITQLPLRLSYALTVHKSQGLSIDKLMIDCKNFFTASQLYVAFTRVSNPDNFVIENFSMNSLMQHAPQVKWFYDEVAQFQNDILDKQLLEKPKIIETPNNDLDDWDDDIPF